MLPVIVCITGEYHHINHVTISCLGALRPTGTSAPHGDRKLWTPTGLCHVRCIPRSRSATRAHVPHNPAVSALLMFFFSIAARTNLYGGEIRLLVVSPRQRIPMFRGTNCAVAKPNSRECQVKDLELCDVPIRATCCVIRVIRVVACNTLLRSLHCNLRSRSGLYV